MIEENRRELECQNDGDDRRIAEGMSYEMDYGLSDQFDRLE